MKALLLAVLLPSASISGVLAEAETRLAADRPDEAIEILRGALSEHPGVPEILALLSRAYEARARRHLEAGRLDAAEGDVEEAIAADPSAAARLTPIRAEVFRRRIEAEVEAGDLEAAGERVRELERRGLLFDALRPLAARVALQTAETYAAAGRDFEALRAARRALWYDSSLVAADLLLARLYYAREELDLAREHLRAAERKAAGRIEGIEEAIARIEREAEASRAYEAMEVERIRVRFDGAERPELFHIALPTLLSARDHVARMLERPNDLPVTVILYTAEDFVRAADAPDWAGGVYDGKVRIRGGEVVREKALARIARHEIAHAYLEGMAPGRFPAWVHEGVATVAEVESWEAPRGMELLALRVRDEWIPLSALEVPFSRNEAVANHPDGVRLAYAQSAAAIDFLRRMYGTGKMIAFLQALAAGEPVEAAVREATFLPLEDFERRVREYVTWQYGR